MIISPIPLDFCPEYLRIVLMIPPILVLNVARRNCSDPDTECYWQIVYCEDDTHKLIYLNENIPGYNNTLEISFDEMSETRPSRTLENRIRKFAKLWGTTVEDLIDRIMEKRPSSW